MDGTWHILLTVVYWGVSEKLTYSIMHVFQFLLMTSLYWSQNLFHITVTREISIFSRMFSLRSIVMRHTTKGNECGCMFACEMTPYLNSGNTEECIPSFNIQNTYLRVEGCNQEDHKLLSQGSQNLFHHSFCFSPWGFPGSFIINAIHSRLWKTELRGKHRLPKTFLVQAEKTLAVLGGMIVGNTQDCRFEGSSKHGEKIGRSEIKLRYRLEDECRNLRNGIKPKRTNFKKMVFQLTIKV